MSRICPLFSGSTGNSTYISSAAGGILIDAGASFRGICDAIAAAGGNIEELQAVAVTHEHTDHIKGLSTLLKKTGVPLLASSETLEVLAQRGLIPSHTPLISAGESAKQAGDFSISRFATSHDCVGSSGYVITLPDGKRVAVCTDLGVITEEILAVLRGCTAVLIESNHDVTMLKNGPYPPMLKLRILSEQGHLSNGACAAVLPQLVASGTTRLILGHLSQKNNLPMLALSAARAALCDAGMDPARDCLLSVAKPYGNGVTVI